MRRKLFSSVLNARTFTIETNPGRTETCPEQRRRESDRPLGFLHARGLPLQLAEEVQLGAADAGGAHDVDLVDDRRMQREDALHTLPERNLANGECRARAAAMHPDHHALEHLDALFVAFANFHVDADCVPRLDRGPGRELSLLDGFNGSHYSAPFAPCSNNSCSKARSSGSSLDGSSIRSGRRSSVRLSASRLRQRSISA